MLNKTTDFVIQVVLWVVFFLIVTPAGLLIRMLGIDFLERKIDPNASSYWRRHV